MKKFLYGFTVALVFALTLAPVALAANADAEKFYSEGWDAYNAGGYRKAVALWTRAANRGHSEAQFNLGRVYRTGDVVTQDYKKAADWYRKAADQGDDNAQYWIGYMYAMGQGVTKDDKQAAAWLTKSAEQGNDNAQLAIGVMYSYGQGVPKDLNKALEYVYMSAQQGNELALERLEMLLSQLADELPEK